MYLLLPRILTACIQFIRLMYSLGQRILEVFKMWELFPFLLMGAALLNSTFVLLLAINRLVLQPSKPSGFI